MGTIGGRDPEGSGARLERARIGAQTGDSWVTLTPQLTSETPCSPLQHRRTVTSQGSCGPGQRWWAEHQAPNPPPEEHGLGDGEGGRQVVGLRRGLSAAVSNLLEAENNTIRSRGCEGPPGSVGTFSLSFSALCCQISGGTLFIGRLHRPHLQGVSPVTELILAIAGSAANWTAVTWTASTYPLRVALHSTASVPGGAS